MSNVKCFRQEFIVDNAGKMEQIRQQFSFDVWSCSDSVDVVSLSGSDVEEKSVVESIQRARLFFDMVIDLDDFMPD